MTHFTVDVIAAPVTDGRWTLLREVLQTVPGTLLIEDDAEPRLMIPVEADTPMQAATFVDGVSQVIGFTIERGQIYETPEVDFDVEVDDPVTHAGPNTAALTVQTWFDEIPPVPERPSHRRAAYA